MNDLKQLAQMDWWQVFLAICLLFFCLKALWTLYDYIFVEKLGLKTRKMRQKEQESELLKTTYELAKTTAENLDKLQARHSKDEEESRKDRKALHDEMSKFNENRVSDRQVSIEREKRLDDRITEGNEYRDKIIDHISDSLNKLTRMFVDKEVDDMRWEILNFCSALTSGRQYNKESFDHVIQIYEKYEKILEEHDMENGQVTASMEVIMDVYKEKLKNGF